VERMAESDSFVELGGRKSILSPGSNGKRTKADEKNIDNQVQ
jgi:hypothetical protein